MCGRSESKIDLFSPLSFLLPFGVVGLLLLVLTTCFFIVRLTLETLIGFLPLPP